MGKALGLRRYGFSSQLYHNFPVCLLGVKEKKKGTEMNGSSRVCTTLHDLCCVLWLSVAAC